MGGEYRLLAARFVFTPHYLPSSAYPYMFTIALRHARAHSVRVFRSVCGVRTRVA